MQAALSCVTGAIVCLWSCTRNFLHSSHFMSEAYAWFGAAYFFYDIWSMYKVYIVTPNTKKSHKKESSDDKINFKTSPSNEELIFPDQTNETEKNGATTSETQYSFTLKNDMSLIDIVLSFLLYCKDQPIIIMHHIFIGGFGFLVIVVRSLTFVLAYVGLISLILLFFQYLRGGLGDCVFGFVYLMELSTPFVSLRSILSRLKMKSTLLYLINGILMLVTFFVCRILVMPYLCWIYSQTIGLPYWEVNCPRFNTFLYYCPSWLTYLVIFRRSKASRLVAKSLYRFCCSLNCIGFI